VLCLQSTEFIVWEEWFTKTQQGGLVKQQCKLKWVMGKGFLQLVTIDAL